MPSLISAVRASLYPPGPYMQKGALLVECASVTALKFLVILSLHWWPVSGGLMERWGTGQGGSLSSHTHCSCPLQDMLSTAESLPGLSLCPMTAATLGMGANWVTLAESQCFSEALLAWVLGRSRSGTPALTWRCLPHSGHGWLDSGSGGDELVGHP